MSWKVIITASAKKQLRRLPKPDFYKVSAVVGQLTINPFDFSGLVKLSDKDDTWRIRMGSYRIKLELFQKEKAVFIPGAGLELASLERSQFYPYSRREE